MKIFIPYIVAMAGIVIALTMISELERRCSSAEKARDAYRPIVFQYLDSESGAEDAPPPPSLSIDDKMNLRMLDAKSSATLITPLIAKWTIIGGLILFSAALSWQSRLEKRLQKAEQDAPSKGG